MNTSERYVRGNKDAPLTIPGKDSAIEFSLDLLNAAAK
jgi:hypothetical protein